MLSKSQIKYIQSLHHKKFRDEEGVFFAEGNKVVAELLQSEFVCKQLIALPAWANNNEILVSKYCKDGFIEIKDFELEKVSALSTPNEVLAIFVKATPEAIMVNGKITIVLDNIQDPGNLGTIIRIADWFGISSVICSENSVDVYNPKVVQSTMGSLARVNILYTSLLEWLQQNKKTKIYAAALNGKQANDINNIKEGIIIIGNESKGISDELMQLADERITIPKIGKAESLNAAIATGIILSHLTSNS